MLIISQGLLEQIQRHGQSSYPFEGCGLLLGQMDIGRNTVQAVHPAPNSWETEEEKRVRFRISDSDMLDAELEAVEMNLDVIGIFHSHPDHPPTASPRDLVWATWPGYSYLITEMANGKSGSSKSWQLRNDRQGFDEEEILLRDRRDT